MSAPLPILLGWLSRRPTGNPKNINAIAAHAAASALDVQAGGNHYKKLAVQPIEYIHANGIPFAEGSVIKYVTRWRDKGGIEDLKKARHFLDLLIELEVKAAQQSGQPAPGSTSP